MTNFSVIYDSFMMLVSDFRLITLFNTSQTDFETYLSAWLYSAIEDFSGICDQSLANSGGSFTETLTQKNIKVLAALMKKYWLEKEIDNILQMENLVQDRDFKTFSAAQNMTAKQARYTLEKEEISQMLVDYSLNNTVDWSAWYAGTFYVP